MSQEFHVPTGASRHLISHRRPLDDADWRELNRGLARRVHGVFASCKLGRAIPWRNRAEQDLMVLLEADGRIRDYEPTPERINLAIDGRRFHHYPSFRVWTRTSEITLDVFATLEDGGPHPLAELAAQAYEERGIAYKALSLAEVRLEPRFSNAKHILGYRRYHPTPEARLRVMEALSRRGGQARVGDIANDLGGDRDAAAMVFAIAARGDLYLDMSASRPLLMVASLSEGGLA